MDDKTTLRQCGDEIRLPKIAWKDVLNPTYQLVTRLTKICEEIGFFIITDHPVPHELIEQVAERSRHFFSLPLEVKERYGHSKQITDPPNCRGYNCTEKLAYDGATLDMKQMFDFGIEQPLQKGVPFTGPNVAPDDSVSPHFTKSLCDIQHCVISEMLIPFSRLLSLTLGKPKHFLDDYMKDPTLIQRVIYYPAREGSAGKHTDTAMFTLLFQEQGSEESGHGSLQVNSQGVWIPVEANVKDVVVNLGDVFQCWTGNRFTSTPHRVIHNGKRSRVSIPFFFYPNINSEFIPMNTPNAEAVRVQDIAVKNFTSIWVNKTGAGRAEAVSTL